MFIHERIEGKRIWKEHADGWNGCLDGLAAYVQLTRTPIACDPQQ